MLTIKLLSPDDAKIWKNIRLEALLINPEAFASSYEDEKEKPDSFFASTLERNNVFAAFEEGRPIGVGGYFVSQQPKMKHRGTLFGMYVKQEKRGQGVGGLLVEAIVDRARSHIMQLHLSVVTSNVSAIQLYQKFGFQIYGTEPRALIVEGCNYDEHLMVKKFV